ncbi:ATP-binding protein [uncultured Cellulomonas sp.]|uniref:ATP-binding protein n=1 Tax=uncultured Cellulomonas sp. TaxID=189682 RepID=UPI002632D1D0|nr:ATP-binding protein [uncultured Cellulomonas sp.]
MDDRRVDRPRIDLVRRPAVQLPSPLLARPASLAAPPGPFVPHRARELARVACSAWRLPELTDAATLVAGELVTNAVIHAQTFLELHLIRHDDELVVAVHDRDPGFDAGWWDGPCTPDVAEPRGARYGLYVVQTLARRHGGYQHEDGGKVMWAALGAGTSDVPPHDAPSRAGAAEPLRPRPAPVRRTIVVNRARPTHPDRDRWRLELVLGWLPDDPDHVDLSLRPTPLHPALPSGTWRTDLDTLRRGLAGSVRSGPVAVHPDDHGRTVLLELAARRPHLVHCPPHQLRVFLDAVDDAAAGRRSADTTPDRAAET